MSALNCSIYIFFCSFKKKMIDYERVSQGIDSGETGFGEANRHYKPQYPGYLFLMG